MSAKHTPGPWFETNFFDIMDGQGTFVGVSFRGDDAERTANARLIAAAPDLLEVLREATLALDGFAKGEGVTKPIEQTILSARAVIAKATAFISLDPDREGK